MRKKATEWPERNELVIGTVSRVNPYSAFVSLEEYEKEGMIHISEVAGKWVRDIRKFVKVGQKIVVRVMRVDREKGHINLSLKRVRRFDAESKMKEYKRGLKAEKMLAQVAKKLNMDLKKAYEEIGFKLNDIFGEMFKAFQTSLTDKGYEILLRKGVPEEWAKVIKSVAEEQMEIKEVDIKGMVELKCFKPDGVKIIKKILSDAKKKYDLDTKYISAPRYSLSLKTKDAKAGERKLKEAAEDIIQNIKNFDGEGVFKAG